MYMCINPSRLIFLSLPIMQLPTLNNIKAVLEPIIFTKKTVQYAELICKQAHWGQMDRDNTQHWEHCIAVAWQMMGNETLEIIALLHDVKEDCKNKAILSKYQSYVYNPNHVIAQALDALTWRVGEPRSVYMRRIVSNEYAIIVKMADLRHNLSRIEPERVEKKKQYERELRMLLKALWRINHVHINNVARQDQTLDKVVFI